MNIKFEKWHGCKNDFIVVRTFPNQDMIIDSLIRQASNLCHRDGSGVGADGIIVLEMESQDDLDPSKLKIINSDGSIAETCGNGIRCAALSVYLDYFSHNQSPPEVLELNLENSTVTARFLNTSDKPSASKLPLVAVEMGIPKINSDAPIYEKAKESIVALAENMPELQTDFSVCELSNNHIVFYLEEISEELIKSVGSKLQQSDHWDGINVHLASPVEIDDKEKNAARNLLGSDVGEGYEALVWERGAGLTNACGSGACAIAASEFESGNASRDDWLAIDMPGGRLFVKQDAEDDPVVLAGPGVLVFKGTLDL